MHEADPLSIHALSPDWVDEVLLAGPGDEVCLRLAEPVTRAHLRELVGRRQVALAAAGLSRGGAVALRLPPSLAFITNLLASWRIGAQAALLDHRLTPYEVDNALHRLAPTVVVAPADPVAGGLRAFHDVREAETVHPGGGPAATPHAVLQL